LLGSGFGQKGSTSNIGASTIGGCDSSARWPSASITMAVTQPVARMIWRLLICRWSKRVAQGQTP
jgi:hypothetical protein